MNSINRNNLITAIVCTSFCMGTAALAQQSGDSSGYQGVSKPPQDTIETSPDPAAAPILAKPSAGVVAAQPSAPTQNYAPAPTSNYAPAPSSTGPVYGPPTDPDAGIVTTNAPGVGNSPQVLYTRPAVADPDGDIVHPRPARPGELVEGATIRVRLIGRLSSSQSERGEPFRGQVAFDVLQDGKVMIPAGSALEGRVSSVSAGHFGGHGSLRLKPETIILPDGSRYQLHAETTGTPGSKTRMGAEGSINPGSRAKKDGIEYGAVVGTGAVTGAVLGGPVGALTGSLIGAGIVTTHLMADHPQATLEPGSLLMFTLTEPMNLMPASN